MGHSYSALTAFTECPYRYYLCYIEKKKSKPNRYALRGQKFHKEMEEAGKRSFDDFKSFIFTNNPILFPVTEWIEQRGFKQPEGIELKLKNEAYEFTGVIDRVDYANGKRYITDFKTGKNRGIEPHIRQLSIYHWLLETVEHRKADYWGVYYLDDHRYYEVPADENIVRETVQWIEQKVLEIKNTNTFLKCPSTRCAYCDFQHICKG